MIEKWLVILFELSMTFEFVITLNFWAILFKYQEGTIYNKILINLAVHLVPFLLLLIEFVQNRIRFVFRHLVVAALILVGYSVINIILTLKRGEPIYPKVTYKNGISYVFLSTALVTLVVGWILLYYLSHKKDDLYKRRELRNN